MYRANQIRFGTRRLAVLFIFAVSRLANVLAEITRMFAVECLHNRLLERAMLRIIKYHRRPGD